jgi:hypothetical protein
MRVLFLPCRCTSHEFCSHGLKENVPCLEGHFLRLLHHTDRVFESALAPRHDQINGCRNFDRARGGAQ